MDYYSYVTQYYDELNQNAGGLFIRMLKLRNQVSEKLGYDNYAEYSYAQYARDYTLQDADAFAEDVKTYLVPLLVELTQNPPAASGGTTYMNTTAEDTLNTLKKVLPDISPDMVEAMNYMTKYGLYDFSGGDNKMEGGYTTELSAYHLPFINIKWAEGTNETSTVFQEFVHIYNSYRFSSTGWNATTDLDQAEIHSQGLELLLQQYYGDIYGDLADAAKVDSLTTMVNTIISGCMEDEFQRKLYANPDMTLAELNTLYGQLCKEYHLYDGYYFSNDFWSKMWVTIPHTFQVPLYYISYSTSLVAALEIWEKAQTDPKGAKELYLKVQDFSASEPFLATLNACGMTSPFAPGRVKELAQTLTNFFDDVRAQEKAANP
jgi:M3 family oligoendopeptidase